MRVAQGEAARGEDADRRDPPEVQCFGGGGRPSRPVAAHDDRGVGRCRGGLSRQAGAARGGEVRGVFRPNRSHRRGSVAALSGGLGSPMTERLDRVSEELREVLAEEIQKLKDPRVGFVTVTGVRVTPDLRKARVFYTVLGEDRDRNATRAAL